MHICVSPPLRNCVPPPLRNCVPVCVCVCVCVCVNGYASTADLSLRIYAQVEHCGRLVPLEQPRRLLQPLLLFLMGAGVRPSELTAMHTALVSHERPGDPQTVRFDGDGATYQLYL
jgi:hypothetical protein